MRISPIPLNVYQAKQTSFGSTARSYHLDDGMYMCSSTSLFREDLDWKNFSAFLLEHFKDKDKVNIVQYASSDGSEAYTQIISLLETGQNCRKFFPIKAFDIDAEVVKAAKSGRLNMTYRDRQFLDVNTNQFNKYFSVAKKPLTLPGEGAFKFTTQQGAFVEYCSDFKTYDVSPMLKSRVDFQQGDLFRLATKLEDNSNTVLLCRNVLGYYSEIEVNSFFIILNAKLKKGSLLALGKADTHESKIETLLEHFNFEKVMKHVYKKL